MKKIGLMSGALCIVPCALCLAAGPQPGAVAVKTAKAAVVEETEP